LHQRSSLHKLPYHSLLLQLPSSSYLGTDNGENTAHCCAPVVSVGIWLLRSSYSVTTPYIPLLKICCLAVDVVSLFVSPSLHSNGSTCCKINVTLQTSGVYLGLFATAAARSQCYLDVVWELQYKNEWRSGSGHLLFSQT
jgi:hypothetical protein